MGRNLCPRGQVLEYWKDWLISEQGWFLVELQFPFCWVCGRTWYDYRGPKGKKINLKDICFNVLAWEEIIQVWNKCEPLERCHIIPHSLDGKDEPANLFLMCRECHDNAPDTTHKDDFFTWVNSQEWRITKQRKEMICKLKEELRTFGLNDLEDDECKELCSILESSQFRDWLDKNIGSHRASGGGCARKLSSFVAGLARYWKSHKRNNKAIQPELPFNKNVVEDNG